MQLNLDSYIIITTFRWSMAISDYFTDMRFHALLEIHEVIAWNICKH